MTYFPGSPLRKKSAYPHSDKAVLDELRNQLKDRTAVDRLLKKPATGANGKAQNPQATTAPKKPYDTAFRNCINFVTDLADADLWSRPWSWWF